MKTKFEQEPVKIDSNVTIIPPRKIEILYIPNNGWSIRIDSVYIRSQGVIRYWDDLVRPLQYLKTHHLIVTDAIEELDRVLKKI